MSNATQPATVPVPKIIWGAMTLSHLLLVFVAYTAVKPGLAEEIGALAENVGLSERKLLPLPDFSDPMALTFTALAVFSFLASFFFPRFIAKASDGPARAHAHDEAQLIRFALTPLILTWALTESVTLLGLVLAFHSRQPDAILIFFAAGILRHLYAFPSTARIRSLWKLQ